MASQEMVKFELSNFFKTVPLYIESYLDQMPLIFYYKSQAN